MMEAASTSETSANFYKTTWRYDPEDSHFDSRRRENLKSYYFPRAATGYYNRATLRLAWN
jgi:hypothetical protein